MTTGLTSRAFDWGDLDGLHRLMQAMPAGMQPHIGDFYWGLRGTPDYDLLRDMHAWFDGDALVAVAWLDPPNSSDAVMAADAGEGVLDEALDWLDSAHRARSNEPFAIVAQHRDAARIDALRRRGYAASAEGNLRFWRRLDAAPEPAALATGFSLRHVASDEDIERRAFVESSSFGGALSAERWRLLTKRLPHYRPTLDLIAVAPDGTGASAGTCWYDEESRVGEFEAVGTAKEYQRLGLGKAVIIGGLRRLHALGAREAMLYTSIGNVAGMALYRSCGFEVVGEDRAWLRRA